MLISLANFAGVAPKLAPFMLQPNQAQVAANTRLWTGALESLPAPLARKTGLAANIETIYRFGQDTPGDTNYWFAWDKHVHVVKGPIAGDTTERTYFAGDGYPKVTNNEVALASAPYPAAAYRLGVPAPALAPSVTVGAAPTTQDINVTTGVNTAKVFVKNDFDSSEDKSMVFDAIIVATIPTAGTLTYNGTAATEGQEVTTADLAAGKLVFTPATDAKLSPYTTYKFKLKSGTYTSPAYTLTINVNNKPTAADSTFSVNEDAIGAFSLSSFGYADSNSDPLSDVIIKTLPSIGTLAVYGVSVYVDQAIPASDIAAGRLTFTSVANGFGAPYTSFRFKVSDGEDQSDATYTMTLNVTSVNDAPTSTGGILRTRKNTTKAFKVEDFGFKDQDTADSLQSVVFTNLPTNGSITLSDAAIAIGQTIPVASINSGLLKYVPPADATGAPYTNCDFKVSDGTTQSSLTYTMYMYVSDTNSIPTSDGALLTIARNTATALKAADFAYHDADGDSLSSVKIFSLPTAGTLKLNGSNVTVDQVISVANINSGLLVYTPGSNASGVPYASFGFRVYDGSEYSLPYTLTINVNNPPTATSSTVTITKNVPQAITTGNFGYSDVDGSAFTSVKVITRPSVGTLYVNGGVVAINQIVSFADISAGRFIYTPEPDGTGSPYTSFTFKVLDSLNESDATYTMTLNVVSGSATVVVDSATEAAETRAYIYTYVSGWGEESQPSDPVLIDLYPSSQAASISTVAPPSGNYNIATKRIYRTATGSSGTNYYFVDEIPVAQNVYTDAVVGTDLGETLKSLNWSMPPEDLEGLIALPNGFLAGFVGRDIYFSEAYYLHAWPLEYSQSVDYPIVGMAQFGQNVVVLTTGSPYMLTGVDPSSMTLEKLEFEQACLSAKSICRLGPGVVYASPDGLAYIGPDGMHILTADFFTRKEWQTLNPSSIVAEQHDNRYYAFYDTGTVQAGFILDPKSNGTPFVFTDQYYAGLYNDLRNDALYGVRQGTISKLEGGTSVLSYTWRSKQFLLPKPTNFKAAQVIAADYTSLTVKFYADGDLVATIYPTSQNVFMLPGGYKGRVLEVELTGTSTVIAVHVAESVEELRSV